MSEIISNAELPRQEFYGDEAARLAKLRQMDLFGLRDHIFALHDQIPGITPVGPEGFQTEQMCFLDTDRVTVLQTFPHRDDRHALFAFALERAQQCTDVQQAAIVLGVAVTAIHTFPDGNGGTSRAFYAELSRGMSFAEVVTQGLVARQETAEENLAARQQIDLGTVFRQPHIRSITHAYIRAKTELPEYVQDMDFSRDFVSGGERFEWDEAAVNGLTDREAYEMRFAYGFNYGSIDVDNYQGADIGGLMFAIDSLIHKGVLNEQYAQGIKRDGIANFFDLLRQLDAAGKRTLLAHIWTYRYLDAEAQIAIVSPGIGDIELPVTQPERGKMKVSDLVVESSNNYLSSTVRSADTVQVNFA